MIPFNGVVWRILSQDRAEEPCAGVCSPEGRFHHSGQPALYASLSREGAAIAIRRYVSRDDPPRVIVPLRIDAACVRDLRETGEAGAASVVWQDIAAGGLPSPTWKYSDGARAGGAQGMLYASRSQPAFTHIVLFDLDSDVVFCAGPKETWHSPY